MLKVEHLVKQFGGLKAVDNVSFSVKKGSITGLIGPNGSGKTTTLNMISGVLTPTSGSILLEGVDIARLSMRRINAAGIARTFQQIRLFSDLTCYQNVLVGRVRHEHQPWYMPVVAPRFSQRVEKIAREKALEVLDMVGLYDKRLMLGKNLAYGDQRKLEIARALATEPKLLLLDEPVAGMNPTEAASVVELFHRFNDSGITIILVEHAMNVVMNITTEIVVLDKGSIIAAGTPVEILNNEVVAEAYLGKRGRQLGRHGVGKDA